MIDIPRPGSPFHETYLVAAAQCGQLPITEISDTNENCIVSSIAWIAMRDQVRADGPSWRRLDFRSPPSSP